MSIEQIVDEIIEARPHTRARVAVYRRRGRSKFVYGKNGRRQLTIAEISELRAHVSACRKARCRPGNQCWEVGCGRCSPP